MYPGGHGQPPGPPAPGLARRRRLSPEPCSQPRPERPPARWPPLPHPEPQKPMRTTMLSGFQGGTGGGRGGPFFLGRGSWGGTKSKMIVPIMRMISRRMMIQLGMPGPRKIMETLSSRTGRSSRDLRTVVKSIPNHIFHSRNFICERSCPCAKR